MLIKGVFTVPPDAKPHHIAIAAEEYKRRFLSDMEKRGYKLMSPLRLTEGILEGTEVKYYILGYFSIAPRPVMVEVADERVPAMVASGKYRLLD